MKEYNNGYIFDLAYEEDIKGIMELELKYFESLAYKEEDIRRWMNHNPNMFYVVKKNNTVIAFTIIVPITYNCYNKFINGYLTDMNEFELNDIEITMESDYYYFADVVSDNKNPIASMIIFKNILPILCEKPKYVVTTPITNNGKNKALKLNASSITGDNNLELFKPCYINVENSREIAIKMVNTMERILKRK